MWEQPFQLRSSEFAKFGHTFVFIDGMNVKLLAYQICPRSLRQGRRAISRAYSIPKQPRPQAQPLPLRGYCVENTVGNARSGLAENAEKSV